jgi:ketosteroid isomerase-like protein
VGREEENVAVVRALYEAVNREGRWTAVREFADPEIELTTDPRHPLAGTYRGIDSYLRFLDEFEEPYDRTTVEPERWFARGTDVVTFVNVHRRPHGSNADVESRIGFLWTLHAGKIVRERVFGEREKALEAAGMDESDAVGDG